MSKVLLIKPRFIGLEFPFITQPLGLMYIGAVLKKDGHEARIHDCAEDHKDFHVLQCILKECFEIEPVLAHVEPGNMHRNHPGKIRLDHYQQKRSTGDLP